MADNDQRTRIDQPTTYQIRVQGKLDENWSEWFGGLTIMGEGVDEETFITTLTGDVADQATLRGILTKIWDLGLTLISATRLDPGMEEDDPFNGVG